MDSLFNIIKGKPGCVGSPQNSCANNLEMAGSPDLGADPPWIPSGSPSAPKQIPWSSPCIFSAVNPFFAYHSPRMHRRHTHTFRRPPCFFTRFWILLGKARQSASTSRSQLISSQHAFKREAYSCRVSSQGFAGNVLATPRAVGRQSVLFALPLYNPWGDTTLTLLPPGLGTRRRRFTASK